MNPEFYRCAYAHFRKCTPFYLPDGKADEHEEEIICEALQAAVDLSAIPERKIPEDCGLLPVSDKNRQVPLLKKGKSHYRISGRTAPSNAGQFIFRHR